MDSIKRYTKKHGWLVATVLSITAWIVLGWGLVIPSVAAGLSWTTFVVWYAIRAKWWRTQIGQNVMILGVLLAFSFDRLAIVILQTPDAIRTPSQIATGVIMYGLSAAIAIWRTVLVEKAQREGRLEDIRKAELGYTRRSTD